MPAQRPRAAFEPLSPDLNVVELVNSTPNFEQVVRIQCDAIDENGLENFEKLVLLHVIVRGLPLVIEGFDKKLDSAIFSEKWLRNHYSAKRESSARIHEFIMLTVHRGASTRPGRKEECASHDWTLPQEHAHAHETMDQSQLQGSGSSEVIPQRH
jgi:hypothetical protein